MAKECVDLGLTPPESLKDLHGRLAPSTRKNRLAKAPPHGLNGLGILQPGLFKGPKGIRREHLGPLVAVVARGVSPAEDMAKTAQKTVLGKQGKNCISLRDLSLYREGAPLLARLILVVKR